MCHHSRLDLIASLYPKKDLIAQPTTQHVSTQQNTTIDLFRQRSPSVGIVRNQGIGSVLRTSYLLMLGNAEVLRKDRILPFAFVSIDV